jgi:hypothetical protein
MLATGWPVLATQGRRLVAAMSDYAREKPIKTRLFCMDGLMDKNQQLLQVIDFICLLAEKGGFEPPTR